MRGMTLPAFDDWWDYNHPAATEARFREALPQAEQAGDRGYLIALLTQLARTEALQGRFTEAHATLDRAQALLNAGAKRSASVPAGRGGEDLPLAHVRYLLERGRAFNSSGYPDDARPLFLEVWEYGGMPAGAQPPGRGAPLLRVSIRRALQRCLVCRSRGRALAAAQAIGRGGICFADGLEELPMSLHAHASESA